MENNNLKHGHWIETGDYKPSDYGSNYYFKCSICGEETEAEGWSMDYEFCPHCGSIMDGKV